MCSKDYRVHCGWTRLQLRWSRTIIRGWRWTSHEVRAAMVSTAYIHLPRCLGFPKCTVPFRSPGLLHSWGMSFSAWAPVHTHSHRTLTACIWGVHGLFLPVANVIDLLSFLEINEIERQHESTWRCYRVLIAMSHQNEINYI